MQVLGVQRARQFDRVRGAAHVDRGVALRRRGHVVHRREVEEVGDLAAQLRHLLLLDPQQRAAQVADHRLDAVGRSGRRDHRPALHQLVQAPARALAHEQVDLALPVFEQPLDEVAPDESRCARYEVGHGRPRAYPDSGARAPAPARPPRPRRSAALRERRPRRPPGPPSPRAQGPPPASARIPRSQRAGPRASCSAGSARGPPRARAHAPDARPRGRSR